MGRGAAYDADDGDAAAAARSRLDSVSATVGAMADLQRQVVAELVDLWPTSAWLAAGAVSAKTWLLAYTSLSEHEAHRLERIAGLCASHPCLAEAVVSGAMPLRRAGVIGRFATARRQRFLEQVLPALLELNRNTADDDAFTEAVRYWADRVDESVKPRSPGRHHLTTHPSLFGGGEIHAQLSPSAFANVVAAIHAYTQEPDAKDAPHRRSLSERQADALDDMAAAVLAGGRAPSDLDDLDDDEQAAWLEDEELRAEDTFDGTCDTDLLDQELAAGEHASDDGPPAADPVDPLRRHIRAIEGKRRRRTRRRTRARSGATINAVVDVRTLLGLRGDDLDGLVAKSDGFALTRSALERLVCDSGLLVTLFAGPNQVLDANARTEQFTRAQRRAMAARDGGCVFPGCRRPPRFCDAHHLHPRNRGGPTRISNGALLCRFHHRLVHDLRWRLEIVNGHWIAVDPHGQTWTGRPAPPGFAAAA